MNDIVQDWAGKALVHEWYPVADARAAILLCPTADAPRIMHYGRQFEVGSYKFRKHWFHSFNATVCPPWPHMARQSYPTTGGLFPHPPRPSSIQSTVRRVAHEIT